MHLHDHQFFMVAGNKTPFIAHIVYFTRTHHTKWIDLQLKKNILNRFQIVQSHSNKHKSMCTNMCTFIRLDQHTSTERDYYITLHKVKKKKIILLVPACLSMPTTQSTIKTALDLKPTSFWSEPLDHLSRGREDWNTAQSLSLGLFSSVTYNRDAACSFVRELFSMCLNICLHVGSPASQITIRSTCGTHTC